LIFYAYNQPILVLLLLFSVSINIVSSYWIVYGDVKLQKTYAYLGVILNLSILIFFKYSPLFYKSFFKNTVTFDSFFLTLPLPIGISFFTFQGISLIIDVYKQKYVNNKDLVPLSFLQHAKQILFFKGFFPQLISGPIVKAYDFIPQIDTKYFKAIKWEIVFKNLVTGYFLKMVVADNLKEYTRFIDYRYFHYNSSLNLISMLLGYSFQIFADFAGYSLIAIGFAQLFGYRFNANFNFPYISVSFKEFWKRWHISLSSFLMEYLYFPLGGNKKGEFRTYLNLFIVMLLGGLWHGAEWSYAIWGAFHGIALAIERFLGRNLKRKPSNIYKIFKGLIVFIFITIAWLLFKLPNFVDVIYFFSNVIENTKVGINYKNIIFIIIYSLPIIIYHLLYLLKDKPIFKLNRKIEFAFYGVLLFLIINNSGSAGTFIYFQF
jgi:alginate O-acetyltransferase complex protein AlgI